MSTMSIVNEMLEYEQEEEQASDPRAGYAPDAGSEWATAIHHEASLSRFSERSLQEQGVTPAELQKSWSRCIKRITFINSCEAQGLDPDDVAAAHEETAALNVVGG